MTEKTMKEIEQRIQQGLGGSLAKALFMMVTTPADFFKLLAKYAQKDEQAPENMAPSPKGTAPTTVKAALTDEQYGAQHGRGSDQGPSAPPGPST